LIPAISKLSNGDKYMARKGKSTEEIIAALREAEVRIGQGETLGVLDRDVLYAPVAMVHQTAVGDGLSIMDGLL
jgi:hypothetical protein